MLSDVATVGMVRAKRFLADRKAALIERLGLLVAALALVKRGQIVERHRNIWMFKAERLLANGKAALIESLSLRGAALGLKNATQSPNCGRKFSMLLAVAFTSHFYVALGDGGGFPEFPCA